jgi:glycosyltransferase involved in cell wall biosynthesis
VKVSVVMVTLNAEAVIEEALRSIGMQSLQSPQALELIVVDGGSTDRTLEIVGRHAHLQPRILSGPDSGIFDAMNKGLAAATGQAVYFLNADDRLAQPTSLATLASQLHGQSADIVYGDVLIVRDQIDLVRSHQRVRAGLLGYEPLSHQAVLARRSAFERVGAFDTRWRICADLDWFIRCGKAGLAFRHVPRLVCHCLSGGASERHYGLHLKEVQQILHAHRAPARRAVERLRAALHLRADRLANRLLDRPQTRS